MLAASYHRSDRFGVKATYAGDWVVVVDIGKTSYPVDFFNFQDEAKRICAEINDKGYFSTRTVKAIGL